MMKLLSRLCFLVLALSSTARGQDEDKSVIRNPEKDEGGKTLQPVAAGVTSTVTPAQPKGTTLPSSSSSSSRNHMSGNSADQPSTASTVTTRAPKLTTANHGHTDEDDFLVTETKTANESATSNKTASLSPPGWERDYGDDTMTVSTAMTSAASKRETNNGQENSSWGYVILVLIILIVLALSIILYFLRRASRTYSFDLQRPCPVNQLSGTEHTGTFEPVYLDDLDRVAPKDDVTSDDLPPLPLSNGTSLHSGDKGSTGEREEEENGLESLATNDAGLSLDVDPADRTSDQLGSRDVFFDAMSEEQQNENNNSPSFSSTEPFVEINLDDPALCDYLLTSPGAPSSVLPFSSFSFSSSP